MSASMKAPSEMSPVEFALEGLGNARVMRDMFRVMGNTREAEYWAGRVEHWEQLLADAQNASQASQAGRCEAQR